MSFHTSLQTWTLTDVAADVQHADFEIKPRDNVALRKRTLRGGLRDGVEVVEVDNGCLRFTVVPTRGMGLWRAWRGELEVGWRPPGKGPVHPKFVPLAEPSGIG